jgi:hypothetical protein
MGPWIQSSEPNGIDYPITRKGVAVRYLPPLSFELGFSLAPLSIVVASLVTPQPRAEIRDTLHNDENGDALYITPIWESGSSILPGQ